MAIKGAKGKTGRVVVWVILALLIVGLAGFGATNFGGGTRALGEVGDVEITIDEYARELQAELRRLQEATGESITMADARNFGIDRAVLQRLISRAALANEAEKLGLSVGDEQVRREIVAIPAFQGIDGSFDREAYEFVLERNGLTPAEFEEQIRVDTARQLIQAAVSGGVETPGVYVDTLYAYAREARDLSWISLGPEDLEGTLPEPTEEELRAYHEENPEPFTLPEARVITYAWLTPEMLLEQIEIDEEALRELYEQQADRFRQPERRLVERLVFADDAAAQEAADAIASGETSFDALVEDRGLSPDDVDLGEVAREDLGDAAEAVFALDEPGIAGPAPSGLGPALYRVNGILSAQEIEFEDVRDELEAEYAADRARRTIDDMRDELEDLLAGGATLEDLATETPMELGTVEYTPDVEEGAAAYAAFRQAAEAVEVGDFPELGQFEDGGLFALRLDEVRPPQVQPLEDVRDAVAEAWRAERLGNALFEQAQAIADEVGAETSFEELGYETATAEDVLRDGFVEGLPEAAVPAAFEMEPGEVQALRGPQRIVVMRLDGVDAADAASPEAQEMKTAFARQSAQTLANDILDAFVRAAETDAGISVDQSAVNAVQSQFP